jgi:hypothetical protein
MTTVTDFLVAGLEQVRKSWGWFLAFGILLTVLGARAHEDHPEVSESARAT